MVITQLAWRDILGRWLPVTRRRDAVVLDPHDTIRGSLIDRATKRASALGLDVPLRARRRTDKMVDVDFATGATRTFSGPGIAGQQRFEAAAFQRRWAADHEIVKGSPPTPLRGWTAERLEQFLRDHPER